MGAVITLWCICDGPRWLTRNDNSSNAARVAVWFIISSSRMSTVIKILLSMGHASSARIECSVDWLPIRPMALLLQG